MAVRPTWRMMWDLCFYLLTFLFFLLVCIITRGGFEQYLDQGSQTQWLLFYFIFFHCLISLSGWFRAGGVHIVGKMHFLFSFFFFLFSIFHFLFSIFFFLSLRIHLGLLPIGHKKKNTLSFIFFPFVIFLLILIL